MFSDEIIQKFTFSSKLHAFWASGQCGSRPRCKNECVTDYFGCNQPSDSTRQNTVKSDKFSICLKINLNSHLHLKNAYGFRDFLYQFHQKCILFIPIHHFPWQTSNRFCCFSKRNFCCTNNAIEIDQTNRSFSFKNAVFDQTNAKQIQFCWFCAYKCSAKTVAQMFAQIKLFANHYFKDFKYANSPCCRLRCDHD